MSDLTIQIAVLETQMKQIAKQVDEGFKQNSEEHKEIAKMFSDALTLKADSKEVEKLEDNQRWIVRAVVTGFLGAIGSFVYNYFK